MLMPRRSFQDYLVAVGPIFLYSYSVKVFYRHYLKLQMTIHQTQSYAITSLKVKSIFISSQIYEILKPNNNKNEKYLFLISYELTKTQNNNIAFTAKILY